MQRNPHTDWNALDDVIYGCANQAGEDNRNVARMALLLAGLSVEVPGVTMNRLCGSSMEAVATAARAIKCGEAEIVLAGGVESMSRAPFIIPKADSPFSRASKIEDTTIGWRCINPAMKAKYGVDSMPETAEIVAEEYRITREDQDAFALRSQLRAANAIQSCFLSQEIVQVSIPQKKGNPRIFSVDEHPRETSMDALGKLPSVVKPGGTVTAGNASGINDGACALILASEDAAKRYKLTPRVRVVVSAAAGVAPRIMGMGPLPASRKALARAGLKISQMDVIELNEAFAAQALAVLRELELPDDSPLVNPNGGAIALGHPLGASGARLITTSMFHLLRTGGKFALCTMCIGVGQGVAVILERV